MTTEELLTDVLKHWTSDRFRPRGSRRAKARQRAIRRLFKWYYKFPWPTRTRYLEEFRSEDP